MRSLRTSYRSLIDIVSVRASGPRRGRRLWLLVVPVVLFFWLPSTLSGMGSPAPLLPLEDAPELLIPERPRTEAEQDRLESLALWAAGRSLQHRGDREQALRSYQRALRRDPKSAEIAAAIVELASDMDRHAAAARYALMDVESKDFDPMTLRRLGVYLAGEGNWTAAVKLYEKAAAVRQEAKKSAADVFLGMELGRLYLLIDDPRRAADCFAAVIHALERPEQFELDENLIKALLGNPAETFQYMGDAFLAANRPAEARAAFDKVAEHKPGDAIRSYNLARLHANAEKYAEALAELDACLAEGIGGLGVAPYEALAGVLEKTGRKGELIGRLEKLRAAQPTNLPLGYYLAARLRDAGETDRAEALYRELLGVRHTPLGCRELAAILCRAKRFDDLLDLLGESVEKIGVMRTFEGEWQFIHADGEALRGLVDAARKSIGPPPDQNAYGRAAAAALLALEAEEYATAGEFFDLAVAADPHKADETLLLWGVGLLSANRSAEAAAVFRHAIGLKDRSSENPAFQFYLAGALALENQVDEALQAARAAAEGNQTSARYRGRAAWVFYYCRRYDEAAEAYSRLLDELDADHLFAETREMTREARMALSNIAAQKNDLPQAEEWLEQVLDEFPDDPGALNDLGYLWTEQGKYPLRAERMIRRAVAAEPDNAAFRDSLGWSLYKKGNFAEAVAELEKAAARKPNGVVLDHLGDAYLKTGKHEKALAAWRKAAEHFRRENERAKAEIVEKKLTQQ